MCDSERIQKYFFFLNVSTLVMLLTLRTGSCGPEGQVRSK